MRWAAVAVAIAALTSSACAAAPPIPTATPTPAAPEITPLLATTQLRVGTQRVAFLATPLMLLFSYSAWLLLARAATSAL